MNKILLSILTFILLTQPVLAENNKKNPFGILTFLPWNHSWNNYMYKDKADLDRAIKLLDQLGVSIIRVDFAWTLIEKEEGVFNFDRLDYIVKKCQEKNIEILAVLGYSAPWTGAEWNNPPNDKEAFLRYIKTTVSRYFNSVKYWEFWNEPDSFFYWQPQDEMKTYTHLLKKVYPLIKSIDPEAIVLLGGLTSSGLYPLRRILQQGGGKYFDIVNFHFFTDPIKKNNLKNIGWKLYHIEKELKSFNFNKKIWITEIGSPGIKQVRGCLWWYGTCPNERQQSIFLKRAYDFLLKQNVEKIFWAFFQDTDNHFQSGVDFFGLIRKDFSKKPAYHRYQRIIREWNK